MAGKKRLLITGGHPTPALAVIDYIKAHDLPYDICFVGRRYINKREKSDSYEYQEISSRKTPFVHATFERGLRGLLELPFSVIQSAQRIRHEKPDLILSFGGYLGVPICIAAAILRVPVFLHEQTIRPGLANVLLGKLAKKVMISFPETESYFAKEKVVYTGNPLRVGTLGKTSGTTFDHITKPVILVTGGNTGSHAINMHIFTLLSRLLQTHAVIHQIGNVAEYGDWEAAQKCKVGLPSELQSYYIPVQHLTTTDMAAAYQKADVVICRSGANTTLELIALRKPAVLIPLPWAAYNEQRHHAELLSSAHAAEICEQYNPSDALFECIQNVANHVQSYTSHYETLAHYYVPEAAQNIIKTIAQDFARYKTSARKTTN